MPQAKTLMIQGTGSGVGKSLLTAALCRIFKKAGWRVAPFKAQNMSNNSFVAAEGGEIARAQAMQAECAGVAPSVHMNPVLLKPHSLTESQVVVQGRALESMQVRDYYRLQKTLFSKVEDSFRYLEKRFDLVIIEGAGSPAEINLRKFDFANMKMARLARAPVLLAGDIERCGVFASLYGTYALLTRAERRHVKGFIINKFRGEPALLGPGIRYLVNKTRVPFLGTVPYMESLFLDEEDSLDLSADCKEGGLDIAVCRFSRISNFTDLKPLELESRVKVRYFARAQDFGKPDLVILPGTKSTAVDMEFLRKQGLDRLLRRYVKEGGTLLGICGGFQMLGRVIEDRHGMESSRKRMAGLGLLPVKTFFVAEKVTKKVNALVNIRMNGRRIRENVKGYEIHMGRTTGPKDSNQNEGMVQQRNVFGTYLHGLFENDSFRRKFLGALSGNGHGRDRAHAMPFAQAREKSYERIAETVREALDMKKIHAILC